MDQDTTWYGGMPRPRRHCVRWAPTSPMERGTAAPLLCAVFGRVCCGQTAAWIKIPPGTEVGLGPGDIVLDGDPAPPMERSTAAPNHFSAPCSGRHPRRPAFYPYYRLGSACLAAVMAILPDICHPSSFTYSPQNIQAAEFNLEL